MVRTTASRYNELSGKEWLQYSFSIWRDLKKSGEEKKLNHPAMFPFQLVARLIDIFTIKNGVVLDPFSGVGSTIIAAYKKKRTGIGFELSKEYVKIMNKRLREVKNELNKESGLITPKIHSVDARRLLDYVIPESIDLCVTSPPYWDILNMRRTADGKVTKKYSESDMDIGNINDYNKFLSELKTIFSSIYKSLKPNGHCAMVVMDIRKKDKFFPFHSDVAEKMKELGFEFEDILIWDRQHEYNNMKPLGYPYIFRVNKVHEYILIFKKRAN